MQMTTYNPNGLKVIDYRSAKPLQENLKDLHAEQHDQLLNILTNRGFKQPLNLWHKGDDFFLMDGHQRQRVMIKNDLNDNGSYEVPYFVTEAATKKEAVEQLLEITSQYGKTTPDGLDELASMYELELGDLDIHFDAIDMDKFLDDHMDADEADDEAPEVDEVNPPVSVLGEVYQLGAHRLMCGDSTSLEAVERLMNGAKADMVFTDPPYGMDLDTDFTSLEARGEFKDRSGGSACSKVIGDSGDYDPTHIFNMFGYCKEVFLWGADYYAQTIPERKQGSWLVWDKRVTESLDKAVGSGFELCWSRTKHKRELVRITWSGVFGFNRSEDGDNRVHPTQKPVKLCTWFIQKYSAKGQTVVDLFGGSGSTLVSCEITGRTCYMAELDPKYVDVIRKRFAKHIGAEDWQAATPSIEAVYAS